MSFDDMIKIFDRMDVAKCQEVYILPTWECCFWDRASLKYGWKSTARGGALKLRKWGDPLFSCALVYHCSVSERIWGFIFIAQRKTRANTTTQF